MVLSNVVVKMQVKVGDTVTVRFPESDYRESKEARVLEVPPFTRNVAGVVEKETDKVKVEYVGTEKATPFGNIVECVPVGSVEVK